MSKEQKQALLDRGVQKLTSRKLLVWLTATGLMAWGGLESADWVIVPNVYGMGTYADGGIFSTKPYICGSSYMLRMSNYKKGEWCDAVDGLYWRFIENNREFFARNPRLGLMLKSLDRMNEDRKIKIYNAADAFIERNTT